MVRATLHIATVVVKSTEADAAVVAGGVRWRPVEFRPPSLGTVWLNRFAQA